LQLFERGFGSLRGCRWISRSASGTPSRSSAVRSRSAFSSAPSSSATLVIHSHTRKTMTPAIAPYVLL